MKKLILLSLPFLLAGCSQEELPYNQEPPETSGSPYTRSIEQCLAYADDFFKEISDTATRVSSRQVGSIDILPVNVQTRSEKSDVQSFYIVNYKDNEGFAILSSDIRQTPIYAISESGAINLSDTIFNKGLSSYINQILPTIAKFELESQPETRYTVDPGINIPIYGWRVTVKPMLTTGVKNWDQKSPYNEYAPVYDGEHAFAGCVAVACAQAMSVFQKPASYKGYQFNWPEMLMSKTRDQKLMVARLLSFIGDPENVHINYNYKGTLSSSGEVDSVSRTFVNMGYKPLTRSKFKPQNASRILRSGSPVIVDGSRYNDEGKRVGGHMFIIDGSGVYTAFNFNDIDLDGSYFHCVWGWGGWSNGYYLFQSSKSQLGGEPGFRESDDDDFSIGWVYSNLYNFSKIEPK